MKPPLTLLCFSQMPIFEQLALEEALLRADETNICLINRGSPPAIVLGIAEKPEELLDLPKISRDGIPVIRRFSGGGTVYVDEATLFVTFIIQSKTLPISPFPKPILKWAESFYHPLFASHDFSLQSHDFSLKDRKIGGNAEYIRHGRWLLHTSFLWDYSLEKMNYLLLPKKQPDYRANRSHEDFLTRLKEYYDNLDHLIEVITQRCDELFSIQKDPFDIQRVMSKPHRKSTHFI